MSDEQAIDPNSDESAVVRVLTLARSAPLSDSFKSDLERVCKLALQNLATPPVTGEVGELVEELAYAVWMVGNIDNDEDKARWWDDFQGLWERAATIVAKAHGRGVNCTEGFDAFRATLSNTEQPS